MNNDNWPFDQAPNVAAFTTVYVINQNAPILLVAHYSDDHSWAFMDGSSNSIKNAVMVSMQNIFNRDPSLREIADLPPGWMASRPRIGSQWERKPNPEDQ